MPMNLMQGALSAAILQSRQLPSQTVLSGAALSAFTPGVLGLIVPLMLLRNQAATASTSGSTTSSTGTSVTVTTAVQLVSVPDLMGDSEDQARKTLAGQLVPDVRMAQRKGGGSAGTVVAQDRPPGTLVPQGSSLIVYLQAQNDFGTDTVDAE